MGARDPIASHTSAQQKRRQTGTGRPGGHGWPWQTHRGIFAQSVPAKQRGLAMAYNRAALEQRRCTATKADGTPCRAWAVWDDARQLCVNHAGRHKRGKYGGARTLEERLEALDRPEQKTRYVPCRCPAYAWPHRPGGGLCRWPLPPKFVSTTPAGTHSRSRLRPPWGWRGLIPDGGGLTVSQKMHQAVWRGL